MTLTVVYATLVAVIAVIKVFLTVKKIHGARPGLRTLYDDLERLGRVLVGGGGYDETEAYASEPADVRSYYTSTSFRDYMILHLTYGWGFMHTVLRHPFAAAAEAADRGGLSSLAHVVAHLACAGTARAKRHRHRGIATTTTTSTTSKVLEIGSGKGQNCLYLGAVFGSRGVDVEGVDFVEAHRAHAAREARRLRLADTVRFRCEDVTEPEPDAVPHSYDLVFGVESFCHFDTPEKRRRALAYVADRLEPDGKLVLVDGFRSPEFHRAAHTEMRRRAMRLAERGFQIEAMPSKEDWKAACAARAEDDLVLEDDATLTAEAAPFWTGAWWRAARGLLHVTPAFLLRRLKRRMPHTFDNLVAACFVGQAMHFGVAEYGVLVFRKT